MLDKQLMKFMTKPKARDEEYILLFSVQVYWSFIFILPKKIIRLLEQKLNRLIRFLWSGTDAVKAQAKVIELGA